ncbi:hypothetical protein JHK87_022143 [Glycine soja]|nr:hypothetical protein JHK87_022143 [Glycine soja]
MARCILSHVLAFALVAGLCVFSCLVNVAQAQSANATTDPSEGPDTFLKILIRKVYAMSIVGTIPEELWTLTYLTNLSIGINNFSGELPKELGNLTELRSLAFGSNKFRGSLPSELGKLTNLEQIYFDSSGISGPIPSTFANLKNLLHVRFQGNSFNGSIPSSFSNLSSLTELELRNNNISGSISSTIGELHNLNQLFLGNNKFNGTLPMQKSSSLVNIDLSYNDLSGSLPSWVNEPNLQLNLVANNLDVSNASGLPIGLNCLQKNFPCNQGIGRYSDFAIKCGGNQIRSADGIVYEMDNQTLGPATYFVTDANRWAVSNVGLFTGSSNPVYKSFVSNQFTGTVNSELFQTARLSASSLRYYGLGLENGFYNITLQFAETAILDSTRSWESLGRRVFDIYIQGTRVLKDFDIQKEAGGISYKAIQRQFRFEVTENYLEIHLFWAGKGTCCIPTQDFIPTVSNKPPSSNNNNIGLILGIVLGVGVVSVLSIFAIFCIIRRRRRRDDEKELLGIDTKPYTFSYSELKNATNDFNLENKLGEGGFGPVYKGTLNDGRVIAVKQLSVGSHQGKSQFITEIATISAVQHRKCLTLNWSTRYDICLGVARGLTYLHEESRLRIVHRDVKASNILLDYELIPKISDFGLAKLYDDKKTHISTGVAGTIGYLAPEYAMRGHLTEKADVFSFGVVALELVSGRPNSDSSLEGEKVYLLEWAWQLHEKNCIIDLVDDRLSEFNEEEVKRVVGIALLCTQTSPTLRPSMSRVVAMLSGDIEVSTVTSKPGYLSDWKFEDVSSFMTGIEIKGSDTNYQNSSGSTSMMGGVDYYSPRDVSKPILKETLWEGR